MDCSQGLYFQESGEAVTVFVQYRMIGKLEHSQLQRQQGISLQIFEVEQMLLTKQVAGHHDPLMFRIMKKAIRTSDSRRKMGLIF